MSLFSSASTESSIINSESFFITVIMGLRGEWALYYLIRFGTVKVKTIFKYH